MSRTIYLKKLPLEEALALFLARVTFRQAETTEVIPVDAALGRITSAPVFARLSCPHYHGAAMDGLAVNSRATFGATEGRPLRLTVNREAFHVDTGEALPPGTDAVIKIEDVHLGETPEGEQIEILAALPPWKNVRTVGEDLVVTELILPTGHCIRPHDLGALLAGGVTSVAVKRRPRVLVIPTGSELTQPGAALEPGRIIEFNSRVLGGMIQEWGGEVTRHPIVPSVRDAFHQALQDAAPRYDIVVINAGSSAGSKDFTAEVLAELGELLVHGVSIMPGKPTILGVIGETPVLGIPGYPVSAVIALECFLKPLLNRYFGAVLPERPKVRAVVSQNIPSSLGEEEFLRVKLGKVGERYVALPLGRGAGAISTLVRADGIIRVPRLSEGIDAQQEVVVELWRDPSAVAQNILMAGSHDMALDLLTNALRLAHPHLTFSVSPLGSLGGLAALQRGEAHLAGCHLLDPDSGEYNFPSIARHLQGVEVRVLNFVYREQGLLVPPGNPKHIQSIEDLARRDLSFVNRQRGAGTRILLDAKLKELGASPRSVKGYERMEYTHMAVAVAVASGVADCGLGIRAAAQALGLDFVSLAWERFDLVIPQQFFASPPLQALLGVIRSAPFQERVRELGGYDTKEMGRELAFDPAAATSPRSLSPS